MTPERVLLYARGVEGTKPMAWKSALALAVVLLAPTACAGDSKSEYPTRCPQAAAPGVEWAQCNLRGADLKGADLHGAFIHDVDLSGADMTGVNLTEARVTRTEFEDAILFDANLTDTLFSGGNVHLAKFCKTTMPTGTEANGDC